MQTLAAAEHIRAQPKQRLHIGYSYVETVEAGMNILVKQACLGVRGPRVCDSQLW